MYKRQALAAVLEKAVVTDTAGNTIDLNELVPQADTVDPELEDDESAELESAEVTDEVADSTEEPAKA